MGIQQRQ